jgi:lipoyl-dependent peroxiredoxin subunit D
MGTYYLGTKMSFIESIKEALPEYAKDTKLNLDAVLVRSTLDADVAMGCAVAALAATGNGKVLAVLLADAPVHADSAMTAASIMAQNNVWYPYVEMADDPALKGLPAGLRMNAIATKANFEAFSLAASIVGKCHFCVKAHYETLKTEGYTVEQLRDIGRIASVMNSVAKVLNS